MSNEVRGRFVTEGVWMSARWPLIVSSGGWAIGAGVDAIRARKADIAPPAG